MQAAEDLRAPYWDWASDSMVPPITVPQTVQVNVPNGNTVEQIEIDNPFLTYWFPSEVLDGAYGEWDDEYRERMFRCPPPQSYPDSANELTSERPYRDWVVSEALAFDPVRVSPADMRGPVRFVHAIHNLYGLRVDWRHWDKSGADPQRPSLGRSMRRAIPVL